MSEKELRIPSEVLAQVEALKMSLSNITEQRPDDADLASISKIEAEISSEGKKPKQALIKSQLALYKKELKKTKQEMEQVKNALNLIIELQGSCFNIIAAARKDACNDLYKDSLPEILKETAETLPLWINENNEDIPPLCGAAQPEQGYVAKCGDHVAAYVPVKNNAPEWILAEVNDYSAENEEYKVQDIDDNLNTEYRVSKDKVIPLPAMRANPQEAPGALFCKGTWVLALYENTTCFYKGVVHQPPFKAVDPYKISFVDNDCASGFSKPTSVPQRYVLPFRTYEQPECAAIL